MVGEHFDWSSERTPQESGSPPGGKSFLGRAFRLLWCLRKGLRQSSGHPLRGPLSALCPSR